MPPRAQFGANDEDPLDCSAGKWPCRHEYRGVKSTVLWFRSGVVGVRRLRHLEEMQVVFYAALMTFHVFQTMKREIMGI